jgi:hypothetical protein
MLPHGGNDWGMMGTAIGRNTHLTEVMVNFNLWKIPDVDISDFGRDLSFNRSIKKLSI